MANRIKLKRSSVSGNAPTTGDIEVGEVALNMADQIIHYRDGSDNIKEIVHGPSNDLAAKEGTFLTSNTNTTGLLITDSGYNEPSIQTTGTNQWIDIKPNGTGQTYTSKGVRFDSTFDIRGNISNGSGGNVNFSSPIVNSSSIEAQNGATVSGAELTVNHDATIKTSNSRTTGFLFTDSGYDEPSIQSTGTNQWIDIKPNGTGQLYCGKGVRFDSTFDIRGNISNGSGGNINLNSPVVAAESVTFQDGLQLNATDFTNIGRFSRSTVGSSISIQRTSTNTLAAEDGNDTAYINAEIAASDGTAYPGFFGMQYNSTAGNSFKAATYDDGVSGFTSNIVLEARKTSFDMMDQDLQFSSNGTDQTITPAGELTVKNDFVVHASDGNTTGLKITDDGFGNPMLQATGSNKWLELRSTGTGKIYAGVDVRFDSGFDIRGNITNGSGGNVNVNSNLVVGGSATAQFDNNVFVNGRTYHNDSLNMSGNVGTLTDNDTAPDISWSINHSGGTESLGYFQARYNSAGNSMKLVLQDSGSSTDLFYATPDSFNILNGMNINTATAGTTTMNSQGNNLNFYGETVIFTSQNSNNIELQSDNDVIIDGNNRILMNQIVVLDNQSSDPTGYAGAMYFNTTTNKFRGFDGTSWVDLN